MYVLRQKTWSNQFLDYHREPGQYRIAVELYAPLMRLKGIYPDRHSLMRTLYYIREVGIKAVLRKVKSRVKERLRNEKFLAVGIGTICEADPDALLPVGQRVLFFAPCHPRCLQRLVLPPILCRPLTRMPHQLNLDGNSISYFDASNFVDFLDIAHLAGWSSFSGIDLDQGRLDAAFGKLQELFSQGSRPPWHQLPVRPTPVMESWERSVAAADGRRRAVIFGYGHYAKTIIIPNMPESIKIAKIHEIDPTQIGPGTKVDFPVDTAPILRQGESYDVACISGYHHTHAAIAVSALKSGCDVIIEKPPVTTWEQLRELAVALEESRKRIFVGYTRRYLLFTDFIRRDLGLHAGEPLSYYCIVNMIRTGPLHWYKWPNSRSQIISNGCHWLDHFLLLNHYTPFKSCYSREMNNGDIICWAELENKATFNMVITLHGSMRLGYRENVEIRSKDATVRIRDLSYYTAENEQRIIRRSRILKSLTYNVMYKTIFDKIVTGQPGDSIDSLIQTSRLMLTLEESLHKSR